MLVDTSVLINISTNNEEYLSFHKQLSTSKGILTIDMCVDEFMKASVSKEIFDKKINFTKNLSNLGIEVLPTKLQAIRDSYLKIIEAYKSFTKEKSLTDLYLAATLLYYSKSSEILLITEDVKDFEYKFFDRLGIVNWVKEDQIKLIILCEMFEDLFT